MSPSHSITSATFFMATKTPADVRRPLFRPLCLWFASLLLCFLQQQMPQYTTLPHFVLSKFAKVLLLLLNTPVLNSCAHVRFLQILFDELGAPRRTTKEHCATPVRFSSVPLLWQRLSELLLRLLVLLPFRRKSNPDESIASLSCSLSVSGKDGSRWHREFLQCCQCSCCCPLFFGHICMSHTFVLHLLHFSSRMNALSCFCSSAVCGKLPQCCSMLPSFLLHTFRLSSFHHTLSPPIWHPLS